MFSEPYTPATGPESVSHCERSPSASPPPLANRSAQPLAWAQVNTCIHGRVGRPMSRRPAKREHVYALLRFDEFPDTDVPIQVKVTVKKVLRDRGATEREVKRLNELYANEHCRYWWQETRLVCVETRSS